ncbi:Copia protein, partial [Mucuna pruriens]
MKTSYSQCGSCLAFSGLSPNFLFASIKFKNIFGSLCYVATLWQIERSSMQKLENVYMGHKEGISLTQRKHALELLGDARMLTCEPIFTPMVPNVKLDCRDNDPHLDPSSYRRLIERLTYLINIGSDLSFPANKLSLYVSDPNQIIYLLKNLHHPQLNLVSLFCYNKSTIVIGQNLTFHERTKHIKIDCYLVRDKLQANIIPLLHIIYTNQLADIHTKPLYSPIFRSLLSKLSITNIYNLACKGLSTNIDKEIS